MKIKPISFAKAILFPMLLWIIYSPISPWLDLRVSHFFYHNQQFSSNLFYFSMYQFGIWPAWCVCFIACVSFFCSFLYPRFVQWRSTCIFLLCTMLIGAGLIIHVGFKDHWGRPRPRQVLEFGGTQPFRPYYQLQWKPKGLFKSFTCGHCSMGFYFFTFVFLGIVYRSKVMFWIGWILSIGLGGILSLARIAQGGHFLSDTLATALIMWITSWVLASFLFDEHKSSLTTYESNKRRS
jgi:lipid A 4'-phosphatase